jgi:hypothetical protein
MIRGELRIRNACPLRKHINQQAESEIAIQKFRVRGLHQTMLGQELGESGKPIPRESYVLLACASLC